MSEQLWYETIEEEEKELPEINLLPIEELAPALNAPDKRHILELARPLYDEVGEIIKDLRNKRDSASYMHLVSALNILLEKILILSGNATQRVEVVLPPERKRKIASILTENTLDEKNIKDI
ncbi:MAG: hypothetical protein ACRCX2_21935 [Paraclostridium sp.]